ncbi:MAG: excinuclease ABC subunit UvrC, partial [Bacteroidota bacterium]
DDKSYPWICIKKERFPRVFPTRKVVQDGSEYFGPFASVKLMNGILALIKQLYKLRTCKYQLTEENIRQEKFKVCLEYHIGNCKGPCEDLQTEVSYTEAIEQIRTILKGRVHDVIRSLKTTMEEQAANLEFEYAAVTKNKINLLERYQSRSMVVNPKIDNVDVFSIITDDKYGYVNFMKVINGSVVQSHTLELRKKLDESAEELMGLAILELRQRFNSQSPEVYVPFPMAFELPDTTLFHPQRGDKKKLLELSERNARFFMLERHKEQEKVDPERHSKRILRQLQSDLRMPELPDHIECFDNSNIQGAYPVAACVVFRNGKPAKKDYRHFNIKTVEGPNDFASMEEVIYRRYKRLLEEEEALPQLIIVDGGKGQLSSALKSLDKLDLRGKITIVGIAKKLEEIFFPEDPLPLYIDKRSESLKLIQQLRNEAHRFGITHHRSRRSKGMVGSELAGIPGVGEKTATALLRQFRSVKRVREATENDLADVVPPSKAKLVWAYFHEEKED